MSELPPPDLVSLGDGLFRLRRGNAQCLAWAATSGNETWVWLDGRQYVVTDEADTARRPARADDLALAAPMPATVRAVQVSAGQPVTVGDVLVVLEAMKMEMPIRAPRAGTVRAVRCSVGELVLPGVPLVDLEW